MAAAAKAALVEQVKQLQRSSPEAKLAWEVYCAQSSTGGKDPARHEASALADFVAAVSSGAPPPRPAGAARPPRTAVAAALDGNGEKAALVEQVKQLQRSGPQAKQAWEEFCAANPGGGKDPNRHDASQLVMFMSAYAAGTSFARGSGVPAMHNMAPAWPSYSSYPGPAAMPVAAAVATAGQPTLPQFVKLGQRVSANWRGAWQSYCTIYSNGFSDPAKYDDEFLAGFIDYAGQAVNAGLAAVAAESGVVLDAAPVSTKRPLGSAGPPAKRAAIGMGATPVWAAPDVATDPDKAELVSKVKELQRSDGNAKAAWAGFCDANANGAKDPNRHDKSTLEVFLASFES